MSINNEVSIAEMLSGIDGGLKSAFLHSTEPLHTSDYSQPTLRINGELVGTEDRGIYSGTLYPSKGDTRSIQVSFEEEGSFPNHQTAQAIITDYSPEMETGQILNYTIMPNYGVMKDAEEGLSNHSRENKLNNTDLDRL